MSIEKSDEEISTLAEKARHKRVIDWLQFGEVFDDKLAAWALIILKNQSEFIEQYRSDLANSKKEARVYYRAAKGWMKSYQELKDKYEPEVLVPSGGGSEAGEK